MRNLDLIPLAWRNLLRRKSRTILTVISVIIGAVAIILMLSFGYGMQESTRKQMEDFAQLNSITVTPTKASDSTSKGGQRGYLREQEVEKIRRIPHVKAVLPSKYVPYTLEFQDADLHAPGDMRAIDFDELRKSNIKMKRGAIPQSTNRDPFIVSPSLRVLRYDASKNISIMKPEKDFDFAKARVFVSIMDFGQENAITIGNGPAQNRHMLTYAGTFEKSDLLSPRGVYISFDTLDRLDQKSHRLNASVAGDASKDGQSVSSSAASGKAKNRHYDAATVTVDDLQNTQSVIDAISELQLSAYSDEDFIKSQQEGLRVVQMIFAGIGSISLLVAAIGIANTMLMSIHERTREIGVMKVIGAQVSDIRKMFLIEAMLIGIIGGIFGVIVSYLFSMGANHMFAEFLRQQDLGGDEEILISIIPFWLPFAAFLFSAWIGLLAGYLPARRATRISAIEAIRTE